MGLQSFKDQGKVLGRLRTTDNTDITKSHDIVNHLKRTGFNLDAALKGEAVSDVVPFRALIEEKLLPAVLYTLWMDAENYSAVTHQLYAKSCQLPLNFIVPVRMQKREEEGVVDEKTVESALIAPACRVVAELSEYLGAKEFLFGDTPSSLDALLFALLAPLTKLTKLNSNKLRSELKKSINICQYIDRILKNNFKSEPSTYPSASSAEGSSPDEASASDSELFDWKYDVVLPVSVAGIVMASYAINVFVIARN